MVLLALQFPEKPPHLLQQKISEAFGLARAFGHNFWECPVEGKETPRFKY